nr:immunoglobulin light chain junction region [Macaca mulatta]
CIQGREFPLTF